MRPWRFSHAGGCELLQKTRFLSWDGGVLFEGSRSPHMERFESRFLCMDAWIPHIVFPLVPRNKAVLIHWLWGELPRGLS